MDLNIRVGTPCAYRILLSPKKGNMIDAVYWAEIMYKACTKISLIIGSSAGSPRQTRRGNMIGSDQIKKNGTIHGCFNFGCMMNVNGG